MTEQWQELKETIIEMRDNDGTGTQQETCKFLANYMEILEKQMQQPCEDCISREEMLNGLANIAKAKAKSDAQKALMGRVMFFTEQLPSVTPRMNLAETSQDCISRQGGLMGKFNLEKTCKTCNYVLHTRCKEPCDSCLCTYSNWKCPNWLKDWLSSFDTSSATKCFEAVNILKQRLEGEE